MSYFAQYSELAPPYEAGSRSQNTAYTDRHLSYMEPSLPSNETYSRANSSSAKIEPNEKQEHSHKLSDASSAPYFNQSQDISPFSNRFIGTSELYNVSQLSANDDSRVVPASIAAPLITQQHLNTGRYNQSSDYSLKNGYGPAYHDQVSTTYDNSITSLGDDASQQILSGPQVRDQFSLHPPSYSNSEFPQYDSISNLEPNYVYQGSTPQVSSSHPVYPSLNLTAIASNSMHMDHGNTASTSQLSNPHTFKPHDRRYTTMRNSPVEVQYEQSHDEECLAMKENAFLNNSVQDSQLYTLRTSYPTTQASVIRQRRESVPTNSFASIDLNTAVSSSNSDEHGYDGSMQNYLNPTHRGHDQPQSVSIDDISPRRYPSKCPHPDCVSNPSKLRYFSKGREWRNHFYRTHDKRFICGSDDCQKMFGTDAEAKRHERARHNIGNEEARQWSCSEPNCQARQTNFTRGDKFKDHCDRWHGPFCCSVPGCLRGPGHGCKDQAALDTHVRKEHMPF